MGKNQIHENVESKHALNEYKKKYGKYYNSGYLRSFTEDDLVKYKRSNSSIVKKQKDGKKSKSIFQNRKYWLIDDKYYPIPHFYEKPYISFMIARPIVKAGICLGLAAVLGGAIITPVVLLTGDVDVVLSSNDTLELTSTKAKKNNDFVADFKFKGYTNTFPEHLESVRVNGKTLKENQDYTYSITGLDSARIVIPKNHVRGTIYINAVGYYNGFADDDWSTIINILNDGGTKALKKRYHLDTMVGSYHSINVGDTETYVMVIGENQDIISSNYYQSASLTLAFIDPQSIVKPTTYYDSETPDYPLAYRYSKIRSECTNIFNAIKDEPLKKSINDVTKVTAYYDSEWKKSYDETQDKVFALSLKELGGLDANTMVDVDPTEAENYKSILTIKDDELSYDCENSAYSLFEKSKSTSYIVKSLISSYSQTKSFWTRTPSMTNIEEKKAFCFNAASTEDLPYFEERDMKTGAQTIFIPAFTIGRETSFANDSWDNLITYANEGLDKLKEIYGVDTFVGLERNVVITTEDSKGVKYQELYKARVIGENHDVLASDKNKLAALTFEFTRPIDDLRGSLTSSMSSVCNWEFSNARQLLKTKFIETLPSSIKKGLKEVTKYSSIYYTDEERVLPGTIETNDVLFPLSYKELGALDCNQERTEPRTESRLLLKNPYVSEGDTYQYYINKVNSYDIDGLSTFGARYKGYGYSDKQATDMDYILRSADPTIQDQSLVVVCENSSFPNDKYEVESIRNEYANIVPAFCIGETNKSTKQVFEYDSWDNIVSYANEGLEKLKEVYKLDTFIGKERVVGIDNGYGYENYRVRVIGENHDIVANDTSKKAALTFEFVRCIDSMVRFNDEIESNDWKTCTLRNYCNNDYFNMLPTTLKENIKTVKKVTDCKTGTVSTEERLFPLSIKEIGDNWTDESEVYEYYNFGMFPTATVKSYLAADRYKENARYNNYALRSPDLSGDPENVYTVHNGYIQTYDCFELVGLAPAFAI